MKAVWYGYALEAWIRFVLLCQSKGLTERINEPPWGRCLQGAVDVRWVVVLLCCRRRPESPLAEL